jgi:septal ring-binding cell division protein DamX
MGIWDRLVLLVAWVVTCGLVYLLGFYVGRGTQERRIGVEERVVRLPVTEAPPPEGQRPKAESDLTFYETLGGGEPPPRPAGERAAPPAAPRPAPAPPREAALPTAAAPPAPAAPSPAAAPPAPAAVPPGGTAVRPAPSAAPPAAAVVPPVPPAVMPPPAPAAEAAPASVPGVKRAAAPAEVEAATPPRAAPGWTVHANPTRSRDEADGLVRRLRSRGYEATVVRVLRDGDTWYRVQVGRFPTAAQASDTMQRLREREGVQHVFVATE